MEVVSNFHDKIVEDLRKPEEQVRKSISEHYMTDYNELGKSLQHPTIFALISQLYRSLHFKHSLVSTQTPHTHIQKNTITSHHQIIQTLAQSNF